MEADSYPYFWILVVLGVGGVLAFVKPYAGFLGALLVLTAGHVARFNQTRLPGLGPLLNLSDACVIVALVSFFFDVIADRRRIRMPRIIPAMVLVLFIAGVQSSWKFGWTHETLRSLRWGLQLPIFLFLGANMVTTTDRLQKLIGTLFAGALLAAAQHVLFVANIWQTKSLTMKTYHLMRTIGYWGGCMASAFLLTAVLWRMPARRLLRVLSLTAGCLFLATLFLNQTRSLWLGTIGTVPCLPMVFKDRFPIWRIAKFTLVGVVLLVVGTFCLQRAMPGLSPFEMATGRVTELVSNDAKYNLHRGTREAAFALEMNAWWDGTLIFGRGLWYIQGAEGRTRATLKDIAYAHLGYVTYLSQLGIVGLIVYGLFLPLSVLRDARWLWTLGESDVLDYAALLGGASIICLSLMFAASGHFLSVAYEAPGVLYGALSAAVSARRCGTRIRI